MTVGPLFSVVIVTHNRRALLERTLDTVWQQQFTNYEVIVVDNASTDGTVDWLRTQASRIRLVQHENLGPGPGRNCGARQARGEYLAFLDSDDLWFPWTLSTFAAVLDEFQQPTIVAASLRDFVAEQELDDLAETPRAVESFADYYAAWQRPYFVGAGMTVIRRSAFLASGGFTTEPVNMEDHDLILRLGTEAGFVQVLQPLTLGYRRHAGSVTRDESRNLAGIHFLLDQEVADRYPGGTARRSERRAILGRHVRGAVAGFLRSGDLRHGWGLLRRTWGWSAVWGRAKFLAGVVSWTVQAVVPGRRRTSGDSSVRFTAAAARSESVRQTPAEVQ